MTVTELLVGFDSAWTAHNSGALVGVLRASDGSVRELGVPHVADFGRAERLIVEWQRLDPAQATIVLLDQPTIVPNATGQRPVENIAGSSVSLRRGGMQPSSTSRSDMFGERAPVWRFLDKFGGAVDPLRFAGPCGVIETYPVLAEIALGWTLPDERLAGRLPKYNPHNRRKFSIDDWQYICGKLAQELSARGLDGLCEWIAGAKATPRPVKSDQDGIDACICLLVALWLAESKECLMIGDLDTGYIIVPNGDELRREVERRCIATGRDPSAWVRLFRLSRSTL